MRVKNEFLGTVCLAFGIFLAVIVKYFFMPLNPISTGELEMLSFLSFIAGGSCGMGLLLLAFKLESEFKKNAKNKDVDEFVKKEAVEQMQFLRKTCKKLDKNKKKAKK